MIGDFAELLLGVYFKDELYEKWLRGGGLEDQGACYNFQHRTNGHKTEGHVSACAGGRCYRAMHG